MSSLSLKFVVRLLDASDQLLAWAEVYPEVRPQQSRASCAFMAPGSTRFPIDRDGVATKFSVHWCEPDLARVRDLPEPVAVQAGQTAMFAWIEPVWLISAMKDVPLPATTARSSVTLAPPTGSLTAVDRR